MTRLQPRYQPRLHRRLSLALLLAAMATVLEVTFQAPPAYAGSVVQLLRRLIGYNPPQAAGGERATDRPHVCLISPRISPDGKGGWKTVVTLDAPLLVINGALNEWILTDSDHRVLASALAPLNQPFTGSITLPIDPLQPENSWTLQLRPQGAGGMVYATTTIMAASAEQQQRARALLNSSSDRFEVVQQLAKQGEIALALELTFAPFHHSSPRLSELQSLLRQQGCR